MSRPDSGLCGWCMWQVGPIPFGSQCPPCEFCVQASRQRNNLCSGKTHRHFKVCFWSPFGETKCLFHTISPKANGGVQFRCRHIWLGHLSCASHGLSGEHGVPGGCKARIYTCPPAEAPVNSKALTLACVVGFAGNVMMCPSSSVVFCQQHLHCSKMHGFATQEPC